MIPALTGFRHVLKCEPQFCHTLCEDTNTHITELSWGSWEIMSIKQLEEWAPSLELTLSKDMQNERKRKRKERGKRGRELEWMIAQAKSQHEKSPQLRDSNLEDCSSLFSYDQITGILTLWSSKHIVFKLHVCTQDFYGEKQVFQCF